MAVTGGVPNSPLGLFVKKNYKGAGLQAQVFKKLTKSGFSPPKAPVVGAPVTGPTPNPNAAPVTPELADLSNLQVDQVGSYDAETARQQPRIQGAYNALGTALTTNADETKNRLASLGSLIQSSPLVQGTREAVPGGTATLADAARQGFTANAAVTVGQQSALPGLAKVTGQQTLDNFIAARAGNRDTMLGGFRKSNADAYNAQLDAEQKVADRNAQLRGQNLQLLATQLTQKGALDRATLQALTSTTNNESDNATSRANTDANNATRLTAAQIAAQARAVTSGKNKRPAAGRPGSSQYATARSGYANNLRDDFFRDQPVYENVTQPDGTVKRQKTGTASQNYNTDATPSIVRGIALGLRPAHILQAIRGVDPGYGTDRADAREFVAALEAGGYDRKRANAIAKSLTGFDIYPRAGYAGV